MSGLHKLIVLDDEAAVARRGAELVAEAARQAVAAHGDFAMAASGGHTPWAMYGQLEEQELPWADTAIYQVDERIAPAGSPAQPHPPDRGALDRRPGLAPPDAGGRRRPRAGRSPLRGGAPGRARADPPRPRATTACLLVPGDPVLDVTDRRVAVTGRPYQGTHRMTLTYPVLAEAKRLLWIVTGESKRDPLAKLLAGDASIPAGRVEANESVVLADRAAAPSS